MKKSILYSLAATTLLSTTLLTGILANADESGDTTTTTAKITFTGGNDDPVNPVDPDNPDNPVNPVDPDDPDNHGTDDNGPLSIDYVSNISFGTQ